MTQLRELKLDDEVEYCLPECIKNEGIEHDFQFSGSPVARKKALSAATGYMEIPDHHIGDNAHVRINCCKSQTVYWSHYDTGKVAESCPVATFVVEVEIRSLQVLEAA